MEGGGHLSHPRGPLRQWWYVFVKNKISKTQSEGERENKREVLYSLIV